VNKNERFLADRLFFFDAVCTCFASILKTFEGVSQTLRADLNSCLTTGFNRKGRESFRKENAKPVASKYYYLPKSATETLPIKL